MNRAPLLVALCSAVVLLVVGCGKPSGVTETRLGKIPEELSGLTFSPDGTRYAYAEETESGARMVLDGKPGPEYDDIAAGLHTFSLDSARFLYVAVKGESWIVETDAAGRGSPVDTRIEILDADGKPIDRLLL